MGQISVKDVEIVPLHWLAPLLFGIVLSRYLLVSGAFYAGFYRIFAGRFRARKIDPRPPDPRQVHVELVHSVVTSLVFALSGALVFALWERGSATLYLDPAAYGWPYFFGSFFIFVFLHETYFYWMHRLIHRPALFRSFHRVHHLSSNPTPFASFSFNLLEALLEAAIIPLLLFLLPVHPVPLLAFLTFMTVLGVTNHLGYEIFPRAFARHWLGRWIITPTHHFMHHRYVHHNYGLYFTFWDHWMGTHHPRYESLYEEVTAPGR